MWVATLNEARCGSMASCSRTVSLAPEADVYPNFSPPALDEMPQGSRLVLRAQAERIAEVHRIIARERIGVQCSTNTDWIL